MNWIKALIFGFLFGFLIAFILWGFRIVPGAIWHYKTDITINATMANPMLVRTPSELYFLIMEYENHDDYWYLYDYMVYADGHWSVRNNQWPLTLGISDSYEIFMLPSPSLFNCAEQQIANIRIEKLKHDIWHLQQKQNQYYEAWQDCLGELIDSGLYEIDIEVSSGNVTLRSYKKVPYVGIIKEVEIFRELTDWESVEELEAFLEQDDTDQRIVLKAGSDGVIKFNGQCEDYALQLRDRAMAQGKYLSVIVEEVEGNRYHALCMATIGNEFWYVEPQTDECWLGLYLD